MARSRVGLGIVNDSMAWPAGNGQGQSKRKEWLRRKKNSRSGIEDESRGQKIPASYEEPTELPPLEGALFVRPVSL